MRDSMKLLMPAAVLALAACGNNDRADRADGKQPTIEASRGAGQPATTIHLVLQGGPHAGTYDAKSNDLTCTYGFAGPGSWGNQYSVMGKKSNEFSSLQLIVPDTKDAADGTDRFLITAGFGDLTSSGYTEYTINTGAGLPGGSDDAKKEGSGTVTVADKEKTGKVTFEGKPRTRWRWRAPSTATS